MGFGETAGDQLGDGEWQNNGDAPVTGDAKDEACSRLRSVSALDMGLRALGGGWTGEEPGKGDGDWEQGGRGAYGDLVGRKSSKPASARDLFRLKWGEEPFGEGLEVVEGLAASKRRCRAPKEKERKWIGPWCIGSQFRMSRTQTSASLSTLGVKVSPASGHNWAKSGTWSICSSNFAAIMRQAEATSCHEPSRKELHDKTQSTWRTAACKVVGSRLSSSTTSTSHSTRWCRSSR